MKKPAAQEQEPDVAAAPRSLRGDPLLALLGERVRRLRARRGLTRRMLAQAAQVSERHLANLESGVGNPSLLVLRQVASALNCPIAELLGDETTESPDWLLIRDLLRGRDEEELARVRQAIGELFGGGAAPLRRQGRIALVGLRGAGKSTLGRMLAADLNYPFLELNREIERIAGCAPGEIHSLYGANAYRRYEHRALEEVLAGHAHCVIATPGGLVSEAATFNLLLSRCFTVWLRARPEDHMGRVMAQGDFRPMAGSREAMDDLKLILAERTPFYAKADIAFDTSGMSLEQCYGHFLAAVRGAVQLAA